MTFCFGISRVLEYSLRYSTEYSSSKKAQFAQPWLPGNCKQKLFRPARKQHNNKNTSRHVTWHAIYRPGGIMTSWKI